MAHLLSAEKIGLEYPTKHVLDQVTCGIDDGDRVGIVGANAGGKSSLLSILARRLTPTTGQVTCRGGLRVGFLSQDDELQGSASIEKAVFGDIQRYEWASNSKMRSIMDGLLVGMDLERPIDTLSGGERRKVALAALLVQDWDVLALDEPTNHLDLQAISWLARHLSTRWPASKGGLLVVTHDRWFLDEVVSQTWEVHDQIVEPFSGGYAAYVLARVERDRQAAVVQAKRQNLMRKELAWLRRGAPARTSKPRFRVDAANALIADVPEIRNGVQLSTMAMARLGKKVVDLVDAGFSYTPAPADVSPDTPILTDVTWRIAPGERTGILGPNGAGKSTLLGLVTGRLEPTSGRVTRGKTVRVGFLDQTKDALEEVMDDMVREVIARLKTVFQVEGKDVGPGQLLERLGFPSSALSTRVRELSGGQIRRLQILLVMCQEPNVLILDEPTNDVDTDMLTALEDLLDGWPGTVIVVSHDRYFMERVTDQQYAVLDGRLRHLPGGVDQYLADLDAPARVDSPGKPVATTVSTVSASAHDRALRKTLAGVEAKLAKADQAIEALTHQVTETDPSDWASLHDLGLKIDQARDQREALEAQWLDVAQELEG
ncbi:MAG: ATP-binding cassette domain-containing protein [Propionibacteriaceae bacterium]|nr:ATP-binding cassette domain-containing protein [Propionibacteriaceae bacterium]